MFHPRLIKPFEASFPSKKLLDYTLFDVLLFLYQFAERRNQVVYACEGRGYTALLLKRRYNNLYIL